MTILNYIIWNPDPIIFRVGALEIRWYSLLILLAFLGGRELVKHIYRKEGRPPEDADSLSVWVMFSALIGARLGEIFFYNFGYYLRHPIEAFLPITFEPHFKFTGYRGLAYHGAIVGSLIGIYLYSNYFIGLRGFPPRLRIKRQKKKKQNFLWLSTPLALGVMMGFLVRIGNFVNSEIVGTPTGGEYGVLFVNDVVEQLQYSTEAIAQVKVRKSSTSTTHQAYQPVTLEVTFKNAGYEEGAIRSFLEKHVKQHLTASESIRKHVYEPSEQPLNYKLSKTRKNAYVAQIQTWGIPRHPVQLYESIAYLITLLLHFYWWRQRHKTLPAGVLAGSAMFFCYSLRFLGEFFKEPFNILFEGVVTLTMGHLLSLLTVLGGIVLASYGYVVHKKHEPERKKEVA